MGSRVIESLLHEFWLLTLCLEEAIEDDEWDTVTELLQRREETLRMLEHLDPEPQWLPSLRRAMDADERCQQLLRRKQRALLLDLDHEVQQQRAGEHYETPPSQPPHHFEAEG
ncbi:MAG: flagellar protein FliT [Fimbriimonadales bacterium]